MAKRKLSDSQRASIRKELVTLLRTAETKAEAFRAVAKKYGITTITARWYAKTLKGAPAPLARPAAEKSSGKKAPRAGSAPARVRAPRNGHGAAAGAVEKVVAAVQSAADKAFHRARLARQLIPRWQLFVRKEFSLRKAERKMRREIEAVSRMARTLGEKIKALTS